MGITVTVILIYCCIFGIFLIFKSKTTNAKLLLYTGFISIFFGLTGLGIFVDFITILLTGKNMDNPYGIQLILCFMWFPLLIILSMYLGAELIIPEKKSYIFTIYLILGIMYELFLFLDLEGSYEFNYPRTSGEYLIWGGFIVGSPIFILNIVIWLSGLFLGFGYIYKSFRSVGIIKKKFQFMSIGTFLLIMVGVNNFLLPPSNFNFLFKFVFAIVGYAVGFLFLYLALKEDPDEPKKVHPKKEVKVKESLFRITHRSSQITEEEVYISKEKKICIVCKGKVSRVNYICPECDAFYCIKCSIALGNTENACWVCNEPFDKSKPSKPYRDETEDVKISSEKGSSEKKI